MHRIQTESKRAMFVWPRDCLESYLVVPNALHRILEEELRHDNAPPVKEIEDLLSDILANMYDETQDRIAARMQDVEWRIRHNRIDAAQANPVARAEIGKVWKHGNNPLALAYGKDVLSRVRNGIQQKWNVSFGNARIVEAMLREEVHSDVAALVKQATKALV